MNKWLKKVVSLVLAISMLISPMPATVEVVQQAIYTGETTGLFVQYEGAAYEIFQVPAQDGKSVFCIYTGNGTVIIDEAVVAQLQAVAGEALSMNEAMPSISLEGEVQTIDAADMETMLYADSMEDVLVLDVTSISLPDDSALLLNDKIAQMLLDMPQTPDMPDADPDALLMTMNDFIGETDVEAGEYADMIPEIPSSEEDLFGDALFGDAVDALLSEDAADGLLERAATIITGDMVKVFVNGAEISDGIEHTYDGTVPTVAVEVYAEDGVTKLAEGVDYTVEMTEASANAGTYNVTVSGMGEYIGVTTKSWDIGSRSVTGLEGVEIELLIDGAAVEGNTVPYDGAEHTASVGSVTIGEEEIPVRVMGEDQPVAYEISDLIPVTQTEAGEYSVMVTFVGNYNGFIMKTWTIEAAQTAVTLTVEDAQKNYGDADPAFTYTLTDAEGNAVETADTELAALVVSFERVVPEDMAAEDYDGEAVGTHTITAVVDDATKYPSYLIEVVNGTLTIKGETLTDETENYAAQYDGQAHGLEFVIKDKDGVELTQEQYTVLFQDEEGEYTVTEAPEYKDVTSAMTVKYLITVPGYEPLYGEKTISIAPKAITVTELPGFTAVKVYDGTTAVVGAPQTATIATGVADETVTLTLDIAASAYNSKNVVEANAVTVKFSMDEANYTLANTELVVENSEANEIKITPKELTVIPSAINLDVLNEHFDDQEYTENQKINGVTVDGQTEVVNVDVTTVWEYEWYLWIPIVTNEQSTSAFSAQQNEGVLTSNYTLNTGANSDVVVDILEVQVGQSDIKAAFDLTKVYDGTAQMNIVGETFTVTTQSGNTVQLKVLSAVYTDALGNEMKDVGCVNAVITVDFDETYEGNRGHSLANTVVNVTSETSLITPYQWTVTADQLADFAATKMYDANTGLPSDATASISVFTGIGDGDEIVLDIDLAAGSYTDKNVGCNSANLVFALNADTEINKNYELVNTTETVTGETISITPYQLTVTAEDLAAFASAKLYDSTNVLPPDAVAEITVPVSFGEETVEEVVLDVTGVYDDVNVGCNTANLNFVLNAESEINKNYKLVNAEETLAVTNENIKINQRPVTYSGSFWKYFGQTNDYFRNAAEGDAAAASLLTSSRFTYVMDETAIPAELVDVVRAELDLAIPYFIVTKDYTTTEISKIEETTLLQTEVPASANFVVTGTANIEIRKYAPVVTLAHAGTNGNTPWYMTADEVTVTAAGFNLIDETATPDTLANWQPQVTYTVDEATYARASEKANNLSVTRNVFVRCTVENDDFGAISTDTYAVEYYHDPAYFGEGATYAYTNPVNGESQGLTGRTSAVTTTVTEESYVWNSLAAVAQPTTANLTTVTDITTTFTQYGTDINGNAVSATHIGVAPGTVMTTDITDMAGNEGAAAEVTSVKFVPKALSIQLDGEREGNIVHVTNSGKVTITGQPGEMVVVKHSVNGKNRFFNAVLGESGTYSFMPSEHEGMFKNDTATSHMEQTLTVAYVDTANLQADAVQSDAFYFYYDTQAFPVTAIQWTNRAEKLIVTMPEMGTITSVTIPGATVESGKQGANGENVELSVDLDEASLPTRNADVTVTYVDMAGIESTVTLPNTGVDSGIAIDAIFQPVLLDNDYFDARRTKTLQVTVYGTEFERVNIDLYDRNEQIKLSGTEQWVVSEQGNGYTTFTMSGLPENRELECVISYIDVNGPEFRKTLYFDSHCEQPIITSPVFEEMTTLTGVAERDSVVYVEYQGERYKGTVDRNGYFEIEMPMLFADETFEIHCLDIAYNHTSYEVEIPAKEMVEVAAYPMGKLSADDESMTWYMSTEISLEDGVTEFTRPILAGASFEIGTVTYTVEDGKVTATFAFDVDEESLVFKGASAATLTERKNKLPDGALKAEAFEENTIVYDLTGYENQKTFYLVAQLDCELSIDYVMETYQSDDLQYEAFKQLQ